MIQEKHELNDLLSAIIPVAVYRGTICEKIIGGYRCLGQVVSTPQEIDNLIDASLKNLEDSIK